MADEKYPDWTKMLNEMRGNLSNIQVEGESMIIEIDNATLNLPLDYELLQTEPHKTNLSSFLRYLVTYHYFFASVQRHMPSFLEEKGMPKDFAIKIANDYVSYLRTPIENNLKLEDEMGTVTTVYIDNYITLPLTPSELAKPEHLLKLFKCLELDLANGVTVNKDLQDHLRIMGFAESYQIAILEAYRLYVKDGLEVAAGNKESSWSAIEQIILSIDTENNN